VIELGMFTLACWNVLEELSKVDSLFVSFVQHKNAKRIGTLRVDCVQTGGKSSSYGLDFSMQRICGMLILISKRCICSIDRLDFGF
jgi:hypothetical protein